MSHEFCRILLSNAREEAADKNVDVPKGLTALESMGQYFIEARGMAGVYISADCAYEAKAKFISALIDKAQPEEA